MTQEDKQLLLKDISARLLYGVKAYDILNDRIYTIEWLNPLNAITSGAGLTTPIEECRPYLRSISSMTEDKENEFISLNTVPSPCLLPNHTRMSWYSNATMTDWLNANHFDYRGLIEKGLAIEAPEGMYETE